MANSSVVGSLSVVLSADIAEFKSAMSDAGKASEKAAIDIKRVGEEVAAVGGRLGTVKNLIRDFQGSMEKRTAEEFAIAIKAIGGAAMLSENELRRASNVFSDYISKAKAMGTEVPPHIARVSAEVEKLSGVSAKSSGFIDQIRGAFANLGPATLAAAGGFATALISVEALTQGLRAAIQFVKDSVTQYLEAEKAQRKLVAALEAQRSATPEAIRAMKDLANEFQRTTVFSDDLLTEMQAMLVTVGGVLPDEMRGALEAVTNLASSTYFNGDLRAATIAVSRAFEDNFTALKKTGVEIDETAAKAGGMAYVLGQVQEKFGGQAQADIKSFSGQLQQTENQFDELKETIGEVIVNSTGFQIAFALLRAEIAKIEGEIKLVVTTMKALANMPGPVGTAFQLLVGDLNATSSSLDHVNSAIANYNRMKWGVNPNLPKEWTNYATALATARKEIEALTPAQMEQLKAAHELKRPLGDLAKQFGLSADALSLLTFTTKENKKEVNAAEKAYRDWADEITGAKLLKSLLELESRLERLTREGGLNTKAMKAIAEEADKLGRAGATLTPRLQTLVNQFIGLRSGLVSTSLVLPQLADRFQLTGDEIRALGKDFQDINKKFEDFNKIVNTSKGLQDLFKGGVSGAEIVADQLARTTHRMEDMNRAADAGAQMFAILSATSTGTFSNVTGGISAAIDMIQQLNAAANLASKGGMANMAASAFTIVGAFAQLGAMIQPYVGKNEIDHIFRDVGERWGLSLSKGVAQAIDATHLDIRAAVGRMTDATMLELFKSSSDVRKTIREFAELLNLSAIIEEQGGLDASNLREWEERAKGLFDVIKVGGHVGAAGVRELNTLVGMFIDEAEKSGVAWDDALKTLIDGARDAGIELEVITELVTRRINDLTSAAQEFGGKAPAALQPFIQELLKANALTGEQRKLLEGLAGAPEWEQLQSIAQKYGIELSALGKTFQDARIGDIALQYARDFMTLRDAGGDVNGLLIGMQDEVQALVNDALKFGTAMPEAMRPVLEGLLQMGLLTDENGNKLEDLSRFSFTGTLEDAFKDMKSILEEIRDLLAGALPKAARDAGQQIDNEFKNIFDRIRDRARNMSVTIPVEFDVGQFNPPSGFAVPGAAEGGFISKTGPIIAHAGEVIGPLDELDAMGQVRIDNRLFIDGREVTTSVVRHLREEARRQGVRPI